MYGTYIRKVVDSSCDDHGLDTPINLNAATGAKLTKTAREPMTVDRLGFMPTTKFAYDTLTKGAILTLYKYPKGVSQNKVALAWIALLNGDDVGIEYVVDVDNPPVKAVAPYTGIQDLGLADLNPGDQVVIEVTTQGTGGTYLAGAFQPFFCWHNRAETENNMTSVVNRTPVKATANSNIV